MASFVTPCDESHHRGDGPGFMRHFRLQNDDDPD